MRYSFLLLVFILSLSISGQAPVDLRDTNLATIDSLAIRYAKTISESDLKNYLSILASDALEGRETGSRGQKMAAAFIREHFKDNHLLPMVKADGDSVYFQEFELFRTYEKEIYLQTGDTKFSHPQEIVYYGNANIANPESFILQFVGDGEVQDYRGLEVKDQIVAYFASSMDQIQQRKKIAEDQGAAGVIIMNSDNKTDFESFRDRQHLRSYSISKTPHKSGENILFLGYPQLVADLLNLDLEKLMTAYEKSSSRGKSRYRKLKATVELKIEKVSETFQTENVLGFVEGDQKKDELIVITAHYDHVGTSGDQIYNGADDDGSGTAAVMEMAQAFATAKDNGHGPQRSLLFMTVAGEENGLLGSEFYSDNPAWPLEQTVANLNIDMIGRVDPDHETQDQYVYIIGSDRLSMDLHRINEQVNQLYTGLELDYKYNDENDPNRFYYRSDHYNFAKHNIPIIFYFNGTHADYHQPTDTIDKIRFDLLKQRSDLIFYCAWELANRPERIQLKP